MRTRWDWLAGAGIAALVIILYCKITTLWWTYDDAYILRLVVENKLIAFFTDGSVWPQKLFTPLEPVAYAAQLAAFGLDTSRWFVAQQILIIAAALSLYAALRMFFQAGSAFVAAALYVASVPLCSLTTQLSATHYFQSIALAAFAFALYVRALRAESMKLAAVSAALYFVAELAKETVVPLVVLLFFIPERDVRTRARYAAPHVAAFAAYLLCRRAVLGTILGGYGWAIQGSDWIALLTSLPRKIVLGMAGAGVAVGLTLLALIGIGVLLSVRNRQAALLLIVSLTIAIAPIIPVSKEMQRRYVTMAWFVLAVAFVAGAEVLRRRPRTAWIGLAMLTLAPILAVVTNREEWSSEYQRTKRMSDEGRAFWHLPPSGLLRTPIVPPAAMGELNWLKTSYARKPAGAGWFYDDIYLCAPGTTGREVWQYDSASRAVVNITNRIAGIAQKSCNSIRNDVPLSAEFHYRKDALFWTFGPYHDGQWRVVIANGVQAFDLPRSDGFRLGAPGLSLRVRYASPAGWVTYSPELDLDFVHQPDFAWRR